MKRVRLVGVTIIPRFVVDDGENLADLKVDPLNVTAADWPTFVADNWAALVEGLETDLNPEAADAR